MSLRPDGRGDFSILGTFYPFIFLDVRLEITTCCFTCLQALHIHVGKGPGISFLLILLLFAVNLPSSRLPSLQG